MTPETSDLLRAIEARYGKYTAIIREDVAAYLDRELDLSTRDKQIAVKDALTAYHPTKDGPPDPATIDKAAWRWEANGNRSLYKPREKRPDYSTAPEVEPLTDEDRKRGEDLFRALLPGAMQVAKRLREEREAREGV